MRALLLLALVPVALAQTDEPRHVYLTWQGDTATTMTVVYHTFGAEPGPSAVRYGTDDLDLEGEGASHQIEGLEDERWVHVVELTDLEAGARYQFVAGRGGQRRAFRTVPADARPVRFVTGGDLGVSDEVLRL
ncbi:fibronectin type III domain-containing protein, partial [Rubrivirga sp.]|uniref:fibronectin type III domain-containing protein n=1 Tax=Rubrivirga sp. TaxID=1885344 RepID=UPI003C787F76